MANTVSSSVENDILCKAANSNLMLYGIQIESIDF